MKSLEDVFLHFSHPPLNKKRGRDNSTKSRPSEQKQTMVRPENNIRPLLSVIIPVFNERQTIEELITRVKQVDIDKEIIVIDDGSTDGTREILRRMQGEDNRLIVLYLNENGGRGGALQKGVDTASGEIVINQDADLEYDPQEYVNILEPFLRMEADVVYGSRFKGSITSMNYKNYWANKFFNWLINVLYGSSISDLATCYKACRAHIRKSLILREKGFNMDIEMTAKILKRGHHIVEVPISFKGRSREEGKKISWKDGVSFIVTLFKYRFID